ncbi:MAG: hypothetical protein LBR17_07190 [Bacteroidales bacterium]|jgi:Arc/MetJ-type ribon-helix-helix transcriptional regulator|nr:hypothetical protein [Bacteroidales bacterium]
MRKYLLALGIIAVAITSCGKKELEEQLITQQALNDSIQAALNKRNAEVEDLFAQLNEIEQSLDEMSAKYVDVNKMKNASGEMTADKRNKIKAQLASINQVLNANKAKVDALSRKVNTLNKDNDAMKQFVTNLQAKIFEQEQQIQALTNELEQKKATITNLNKDIEDLNRQNTSKDKHIMQIEDEKNTAYVFIGTRKELIEQGVITRSGGFLGIGRKSLVSSDATLAENHKVDIRRIEDISLPGKKIAFITPQPENSYRLNGDEKKPTGITITDPAKFWEKSRVLIIEVK